MGLCFYTIVNAAAAHWINVDIPGTLEKDHDVITSGTMVYESLLLWSNFWVCISLTVLFVCIAVLNIIFTTYIAYEQCTMLQKELRHKYESIRVQRYLQIKNRPLKGYYLDEKNNKVELTYPEDTR